MTAGRQAVVAAAALAGACGDDRPAEPADARLVVEAGASDASLAGMLFGEPCVQPVFPEIGRCHDELGGCTDEPGGPVCRPFCHAGNAAECAARGGVERVTDRGACVCVPP